MSDHTEDSEKKTTWGIEKMRNDRFRCEDCGAKVPDPCICPFCGGTRWITLEDIEVKAGS